MAGDRVCARARAKIKSSSPQRWFSGVLRVAGVHNFTFAFSLLCSPKENIFKAVWLQWYTGFLDLAGKKKNAC